MLPINSLGISTQPFTAKGVPKACSILLWQITNKASEEDFEVEFPFSKERCVFKTNPFIRMYRCADCGYVEADSKYISGMGIIDLPKRFDIKELSVVLRNISQDLNKHLSVNGVNLDHGNIKSPEKGLIIITDLCTSRYNLRQRSW